MNPTNTNQICIGDTVTITAKHRKGATATVVGVGSNTVEVDFPDGTSDHYGFAGVKISKPVDQTGFTSATRLVVAKARKKFADISAEIESNRKQTADLLNKEAVLIKKRNELSAFISMAQNLEND